MKKKGFMNRKIHLLNSYGKSFMKLSKYRLYGYKNYLYGNLFIDLNRSDKTQSTVANQIAFDVIFSRQ